jgi:hypothetical protein
MKPFKFNREISWSKIAVIVLIIICAWYGKNLKTWKKNEVIKNDVVSYYEYLPAVFIFHDLNFKFTSSLPENFEGSFWVQTGPAGKPIIRMTMGLALLWLPFFLLAHLSAHLLGVSTLGYSWPYSLSILVAALFYLAAGLLAVRKILLRFFTEITTSVVLILLVAGTNLMHYVIVEPGMSHVYSFCLIAVFLLYTFKWFDKSTVLNTVFLGFLGGMIMLIRPVNILILLFPALMGIKSINDFETRLLKNRKMIVVAGLAALITVLPQLIYWKIQTNQFLFNSYMNEGKFYFLNPQVINGLFSYRKGWLIYTPVMILSVAGLFQLKRSVFPLYMPTVLFFILNVYVVFSWWCWWYGGSFGSRVMIDMYGIAAVPMAIIVDKLIKSRWLFRGVTIAVFTFLIFLNQLQMNQYRTSLLHWDSMTGKTYWAIFFRTTFPEGYDQTVRIPDYEKALKGEKEYSK